MIIVENLVQGSDKWIKEKAGVISTSNMKCIVTSKGEPVKSTVSQGYRYKLIGEYFAGPQPGFKSASMEVGNEREQESRDFYTFKTGHEITEVGFIYKDETKLVGCSPDGIRENSGLELKNPQSNTQVKYLLKGKMPTEYIQQVQGAMFVTGFDTWDFMSYVPGMPPLLLTIEKDIDFQRKLEMHLAKFIDELLTERKIIENFGV